MSDDDDDSEDVGRVRDALELPPDEIDAATRERQLARALDAFDEGPARVVPMHRPRRTRRLVSVAAAAAVVLAVVAVGAVFASRGDHDTTATRAAAPATTPTPSTTPPAPLGAEGPADATPGSATSGDAASTKSIGDFPTVDALRAATSSVYDTNSSALDEKSPATPSGGTASAAKGFGPRTCPTPPLDGGRVVGRAVASVAGAPVSVWIVDGAGARRVIVVDDDTCTVRSR